MQNLIAAWMPTGNKDLDTLLSGGAAILAKAFAGEVLTYEAASAKLASVGSTKVIDCITLKIDSSQEPKLRGFYIETNAENTTSVMVAEWCLRYFGGKPYSNKPNVDLPDHPYAEAELIEIIRIIRPASVLGTGKQSFCVNLGFATNVEDQKILTQDWGIRVVETFCQVLAYTKFAPMAVTYPPNHFEHTWYNPPGEWAINGHIVTPEISA